MKIPVNFNMIPSGAITVSSKAIATPSETIAVLNGAHVILSAENAVPSKGNYNSKELSVIPSEEIPTTIVSHHQMIVWSPRNKIYLRVDRDPDLSSITDPMRERFPFPPRKIMSFPLMARLMHVLRGITNLYSKYTIT